MKKGISKGKRCVLIWATRIMAVLVAACITILFAGSYLTFSTQNNEYQYFLPQHERKSIEFENSEIFTDLFYDSINDITRMCVIKNQLEKNGKYDGGKKIDITSYANRTDVIIDDSVTAEYLLDDLIKWGNYGFEYTTITGTTQELNDYIIHMHDSNKNNSLKENEDDILSADAVTNVDDGAIEIESLDILVPRYLSTQGKDLIEYADNIEEYRHLVDNLKISAQNLFQNYTEYMKFNKQYDDGKTNIRYCYQMINNEKLVRYNNLDTDISNMTIDNITSIFSSDHKFIYYNPDKMQITTNVNINAQEMRHIISSYEYAFIDNSRVWISIDDSYNDNDVYQSAKKTYNKFSPYYDVLLLITMIGVIVYMLFIILLTIYEGRPEKNGKNAAISRKIDKLPLELYILSICIIATVAINAFTFIFQRFKYFGFDGYLPILVFGIYAFILNIICLSVYLCGVRKYKDRQLIRNSIFFVLAKRIRKGILEAYDNGQLVSRTWLPYLLFLSLNLVLVLLGLGGIFIAFLFDIVVGVFIYRDNKSRQNIVDGIEFIKEGDFNYQISIEKLHGDNLILANSVNSIGEGIRKAVETSMKDERLKADLITNVSHDIKTPLTSIINYVDLIKRENINEPKIKNYIDVLDKKSQRLKQLTDDLVEASKISSGNISLNFEKINFVELVNQSLGEFSEKFEEKELTFITNLPENPVYIMADSRRIYRVIENLYNNIYKYAMEKTRVYVDLKKNQNVEPLVILSIKNISAQSLNIDADELTERFIRGDVSRGTEGSGLGLSIAKNLTQALKGNFEILLDGDLFKVVLTFPIVE